MLTYGKGFLCIGMWFTMESIQGFQNCYFWFIGTIDPFETYHCHFKDILPQTHFEEILKAITIDDETPTL